MPYIAQMTPKELRQAVEKQWPLLIPAGSVEYHGDQLPLGTDLLIVEGVLREIDKRVGVVIAPPFAYSPTGYMVSGAEQGTVDVNVEVFVAHCAEILKAYKAMGFRDIRVLVHHQGGNIGALVKTAALKINAYEEYRAYGGGWWTERREPEQPCRIEAVPTIIGGTQAFGGHGGKGETQAVMALYPELVRLENVSGRQPFWNESVTKADPEEARREMRTVIDAWVKLLSGI